MSGLHEQNAGANGTGKDRRPSLLHNIVYSTLLNFANIVFPLLLFMWVSRHIGVESIGKVNWAISFTAYFVLLASFGISNYGTRQIARVRGDKELLESTFGRLFSFSLLTTATSSFIFGIVVLSVPTLRSDLPLLLIMFTMVAFAPLSLDWFFQGLENFRYIAIRSISIKFLSLAAMIFLVRKPGDYLIYAALYAAGLCLNYLLNFHYASRLVRIRLRWEGLGPTFSSLLRFALISFAVSLYLGLDKIILGAISGYSSVGLYTPAEKIVRTSLSVVVALCTALLPRMSFVFSAGDAEDGMARLVENSLHAAMLLALPMMVGIFILAEPLVLFFGGISFLPSIDVLRIMDFVILPVAVANVAGFQVLVATGREMRYLVSVLSGTIAFFISAFLLIPRFSARGAAASMFIAESTGAILECVFARDRIRSAFRPRWFAPICVASTIMGLSVWRLAGLIKGKVAVLGVCLLMGALVYTGILVLFRDSLLFSMFERIRTRMR
jgi:O-antigen/teichoic acid export membrane protein